MSPQFKRLLKFCAAVAVVIGVFRLAQIYARTWVKRVDRCDMPCQWDEEKGFDSCQPLKASLEIKTTPNPRGGGYTVWYRATATNQSCATIHLNDSFYLGAAPRISSVDTDHWSFLSVKDSSGKAAPDAIIPGDGDMFGIEKEIHPYRTNTSTVHTQHFKGEHGEYSYFYLKPGESAVTSFDELAPYREKMIDVQTETYIGTGMMPILLHMQHPEKNYPAPPPGFRRLIEYDLRPGRYRAQFFIREDAWIEFYRGSDKSPRASITWRIVHFFAGGPRGSHDFPINVASPPVEINVPQ